MRESRDKSLLALVVVFLLVTVGVRFEIFTPKVAPTVLFPLHAERSGGELFERLEKAGYRVEMSGEWVMIDPRQRVEALGFLLSQGLPDEVLEPNLSQGATLRLKAEEVETVVWEVLSGLDEVAYVELELNLPPPTYFHDDDQRAGCLVKVWTRSGAPLDPLVKSALPYLLNRFASELGPENVSVVENPQDKSGR